MRGKKKTAQKKKTSYHTDWSRINCARITPDTKRPDKKQDVAPESDP